MSKTGKALPSTGVDQSIATFVVGLGLLGLSGYLFFRHKKTRKYLIVFLAASGAGLTGFSAQAAVRALGDVVTDTTTIGATYTYSLTRADHRRLPLCRLHRRTKSSSNYPNHPNHSTC
ncbi:TPA: LPXTG cell wall anchor domain-containing protein [Streptococcus suis]|nr:LPXTG cell wall anchor domain-containing protein [Streptococcus suis]